MFFFFEVDDGIGVNGLRWLIIMDVGKRLKYVI